MRVISELLERLPAVKDFHMSATGTSLWIAWEGDLDPAVPQTLQDYGGMCVTHSRDQALWFFFTTDVFLALARLAVWAQFNPLPVNIEVVPSRLLLGMRREMSVTLDAALVNQEVMIPKKLIIWVHPKAKETAGAMPGITFNPVPYPQGMASLRWEVLEADARLPYTSSQGWYALLRPLGNPLDKRFQNGWRTMFTAIEQVLQKQKFKFNVHDYFVMVPLDNLRHLRFWSRELLQLFGEHKGKTEDYWPCVSVIIDKKGLNFNNELPKKVGIKWDNLMPDFPYMSYRNAFLLGEGFTITDLHYSATQTTMDSWCTVALGEGQAEEGNCIPVLVAGQLVAGESNGCFYCGMRNHDASQCPTKRMPFYDKDVWKRFGELDLDSINEAFRTLEKTLLDQGVNAFHPLLEDPEAPGVLLRALFEINLPCQLRIVDKVWSTSGRDFPKCPEGREEEARKLEMERDDSPAWIFLERFKKLLPTEVASFERDVLASVNRNPRDARLRTLQGFVAMEKGDLARAQSAWKEAETLSSSGLQQCWHQYLQARLLETQGRPSEALDRFQEVVRLSPQWVDADYRQIVCRVKMGFAEQVQPRVYQLIDLSVTTFNRFLIDPELERGHLVILTALYPLWADAKRKAEEEKNHIQRLVTQVDDWFAEDHPVAAKFRSRLDDLRQLAGTTNYMAFLNVISTRPLIEKDITTQVQREIEDLKERYKNYLAVLEVVRDEAAWFPFPRILVEFNRDFNECAGIINWAFSANFHEPDAFKQAQVHIPNVVELLNKLERRLRFLRMVRDSTLYVLILGRTFFWVEIAFLVICLVAVPSVAVFGKDFGLGWLQQMIRNNHWQLQKVLLIIISAMALGIAALRTTLVFEKRRDQLVADARTQREEMQRQRLERIKDAARRDFEAGKRPGRKPPMGDIEGD